MVEEEDCRVEIEAATEEDESVSGASVQAAILVKNSVKKKRRGGSCNMVPPEAMQSFAMSNNRVCKLLIQRAKALGLIITHSGLTKQSNNVGRDRVWFGLCAALRRVVSGEMLDGQVATTLFRFNRHVDGMFHASPKNTATLELYSQYWAAFNNWRKREDPSSAATTQRKLPCVWCSEDVKTLVEMRSQDNPPTFRNIAYTLNRTHERLGSEMHRRFEARDCSNKWAQMFPSSMDTNQTLQHLKHLKKVWPGLIYGVQTEQDSTLDRAPSLTGLYIVWPWAKDMMQTLSPSIFCDATYNVTIYHYKVVMITTLDGNRHHRPLMVCFITRSTKTQWCYVFNIFARHVAPHVERVYAVTSDKEKAISSGLAMSELCVSAAQVMCGLHAKWNVSKHKCVDHRIWSRST